MFTEFVDCLQWTDTDGRLINLYPADTVEETTLPDEWDDLTKGLARLALARCIERTSVAAAESEEERRALDEIIHDIEDVKSREEDARAEAIQIKRGKLPLPGDYNDDKYLWDALARMGLVEPRKDR